MARMSPRTAGLPASREPMDLPSLLLLIILVLQILHMAGVNLR
jgi:hypothetical protein